jgi:DNA-damage-inducible protein J
MELSSVNVRMDKEIKKDAEKLFAEIGINMSTAINIFVRQAVRQQKIPFEISAEVMAKPKPVFGSGKDKIWVADDFDTPLDELKEYME